MDMILYYTILIYAYYIHTYKTYTYICNYDYKQHINV